MFLAQATAAPAAFAGDVKGAGDTAGKDKAAPTSGTAGPDTPSPTGGTAGAGDAAAADVLFKEAKAFAAKQKYAEACPKFEACYNLDKTVGTLMNLADCHEHIGRVASAWSEWNTSAEMLRRAGDPREDYATKRRDALKGRLPYLRIDVKSAAEGLTVFRGAKRIEPGAYNTALPIDPGEHSVVVRRGNLVLKEERVVAAEGKTEVVALDLAAIAASAPPPAADASPKVVLVQPASSGIRTTGIVLAGAGGLALLVAGGLEIAALSKRSDALNTGQCVGDYCSSKGIGLIDSARSFAEAGQWVGVAGILIGGVGLSMILVAPSAPAPQTGLSSEKSARSRPQRSAVRLTPILSPAWSGLTIRGDLW